MQIVLKENQTMSDLVGQLAKSFDMVYDIAPVAYWYEILNEKGRLEEIHFSPRMREILGYKSEKEFPDALSTLMSFTHPDDVHIMLDGAIAAGTGKTDKYDVQYRIRAASGDYIWCNATGELVKDSTGKTVGMYGAFIDITEEIELREKQEIRRHVDEIIKGFSAEHSVVFLVNMADDSFRLLHMDEGMYGGNEKFANFSEAKEYFITTVVSEPDQELICREMDYAVIRQRLAEAPSYGVPYRPSTAAESMDWYEMRITLVDGDLVVFGFCEKTREVISRIMNEKLLDKYDAMYVVDLNNDEILPIRSSRVSRVGGFREKKKYSEMLKKFAFSVAPKYKQDWLSFSNPDYMKLYMADADQREYIYELPEAERPLRRFTIDVQERVNGLPSVLLFTFEGIDDLRAQAILLNRKLAEQNIFNSYFLKGYISAYYINLDDLSFRVYKRPPELDEKYPVVPSYIDSLGKFIADEVHPDDREAMSVLLQPHKLKQLLAEKPEVYIIYRLVSGGEEKIRRATVIRGADESHAAFGFRDITDEIREQQQRSLADKAEKELRHSDFRNKVLKYMIDHDDDPIELLKKFAEEFRVIYGCDQVIYRDLEETRIMVNSPAIEQTWSVPIEYCQQCQHFDAHHPMYKDGYTEMNNCQEGWQGIPVYEKCPIKSSLTRIVYCDGEIAGYIAIHYVQNYHEFTEPERKTFEELARILAISLSRYEANKSKKELEAIRQEKLLGPFIERYDAVYAVNLAEDTFRIIKRKDDLAGEYTELPSGSRALRKYIEDFVLEADKPLMLRETEFSVIAEKLRQNKRHSVEYRALWGDTVQFHEMIAAPSGNENEILVAFVVKDVEIIRRRLSEKQDEDYFALFEIDLDTELIKVIKKTNIYSSLEPGQTAPYSEAIKEYASHLEGEPRAFFEQMSDIDYVKRELAVDDKRTYSFKSILTESGKWVNTCSYVLKRHDDGTPAVFSLGFSFMDTLGVDRQELYEKIAEQKELLEKSLTTIKREKNRFEAVKEIINSAEWSMKFSADDELLGVEFSSDMERVINHELATKPLEWQPPFIHPDDYAAAEASYLAAISDHSGRTPYETSFRMLDRNGKYNWFQVSGRVKLEADGSRELFGIHININERMEEEQKRLLAEKTEVALQHEQFKRETLNAFVIDSEADPVELLKNYAERLRVLIKCDQVIYCDMAETRIIVNAPEFAEKWTVPVEYCRKCLHSDVHHPMYKDGYTEMYDCQVGWQGIPVYKECPVKSALTRLVYCDNEVAGYLAINYIQDYHQFTDIERSTLEEITRILSISLSRYKARKENKELKLIAEMQQELQAALDTANAEAQRNEFLYAIMNANKWSYEINAAGEITAATYSEGIYRQVSIGVAPPSPTGWIEYLHPEDKERVLGEFMAVIKDSSGRTKYDTIFRLVGSDGKAHWTKSAGRILRRSDGTREFFGMTMDLTEQIEKERAQQEQLEEALAFTNYFLSTYGAVYYVNLDDLICQEYKRTNEIAEAYPLGGSYLEIVENYIERGVHPDDKETMRKVLSPEYIKKTLQEKSELLQVFRDISFGEEQILRFQAIRGADESHFAFGFKDVTEEVKAEQQRQQELEEALSMAQAANRAKTTFLNNMSHDIRTPMNAIIGFTGLAASHIDNRERVQDYLSKIGQSSEHLLSLINDVLDMSRIESGKMNLDEKEENLSDIIHTLRDIVEANIHAKQHDFFIDTVNVNDEHIICDKLRLNQVLLNILSNSIKYTASGGTISMRITEKTVKPSGYATFEFCIKDNGMGMDKEFMKTLFDPFTRVKSSTVSGIQGTGLGMAITKNIIEMMGGTIEVESELCKGTTMTVTFDFKLQSAPKAPVEIPALKGVRALVVDDDTSTCMSICKMLVDIGMRDEWCTTGKEAVVRAGEAYQRGDLFKVYIIDWLMPDMNGIETTRRIRKVIGDDVPIIILTAYDWSAVEDEAREAGVTAFVSKPLFPSDLHRVLSKCLDKTEPEAEKKTSGVDFRGRKVLLVEDNELNLEIATELLSEYGLIIDTAEDGHLAVEKLKAARAGDYDIVLMDVQMPTMDGYEATRQIRALGTEISKIPILAMTANAFEEDRRRAVEAGMDDHIAKPIDIAVLKETLAKFL